jgi:MscS family membrane protein
MDITQAPWLNDVIIAVAIVTGFIIAGKALIFVLGRVARKLTEKTETKFDDMVLGVVENPVFYLLVLWGFYIALHRLSVELGSDFFGLADKVVFVIAVALIVKVVYDILGVLVDWYGVRAAERGQEGVRKSILPILKKLIKVFVIISGLIVVLDHFKYNITSLVAALGVSSLAVGLAAKETLSNMISGFTLVVDRPFRVGDRIETDNKMGDVVEIGLRSTRIRTPDNTIVVIPNSKLVDNVVTNYAYPEQSLRCSYKAGVEYGSDVVRVKEILKGAARDIPEIMEVPAPEVLFIEHGEYAMVFQLDYSIPEYSLKDAVKDKLNMLVNRRFAEAGINFAFPTRKVYQQSLAAE